MYGKLHATAFTGSMHGSSLAVFAVWSYAIACADHKGFVELNQRILAHTFNCDAEEVSGAIDYLTAPDPHSRTPDEEGRRMVREGQFLYRIVNYERYRNMRDTDERRTYQREYMARYRADGKDKTRKPPSTLVNTGKPQLAKEDVDVDVDVLKESSATNKPKNGSRFTLTQLPVDWREFCKATRPDLAPEVVFDRFRDYWVAQPGAKGRKSDWLATWRNWCRNEKAASGAKPVEVKPWHLSASGIVSKGSEFGLDQSQFGGDWLAFRTAVYERAGVNA